MLRELNLCEMEMVSGGNGPNPWSDGVPASVTYTDGTHSLHTTLDEINSPSGQSGNTPIFSSEYHDLQVTIGGDPLNPVNVEMSTVTINVSEIARRVIESVTAGNGDVGELDLSGCHNQCNH